MAMEAVGTTVVVVIKVAMETAMARTTGTTSRTVIRMGAPAGTITRVRHVTTRPTVTKRRRRYQTGRAAAIVTAVITIDSGGRLTMI